MVPFNSQQLLRLLLPPHHLFCLRLPLFTSWPGRCLPLPSVFCFLIIGLVGVYFRDDNSKCFEYFILSCLTSNLANLIESSLLFGNPEYSIYFIPSCFLAGSGSLFVVLSILSQPALLDSSNCMLHDGFHDFRISMNFSLISLFFFNSFLPSLRS